LNNFTDVEPSVAASVEAEPGPQPTVADLMRCAPGLKIVLLRLTRNAELAKDLLQDVLEQALQAIRAQRVRSVPALPAFLQTCAHRAVIAELKTRVVTVSEEILDGLAAQDTPLAMLETHEMQALANQALSELSTARDRALIEGFYVHGQSKTQLMQSLSLDRDQFDKTISRARLRLRELMHEKLNRSQRTVSGMPSITLNTRMDNLS
jgi:RNA polymerase sigma factor (sigma-70 family)